MASQDTMSHQQDTYICHVVV